MVKACPGFDVLEDRRNGHTRSLQNPSTTDLAGNAFNNGAFRPIQIGHSGTFQFQIHVPQFRGGVTSHAYLKGGFVQAGSMSFLAKCVKQQKSDVITKVITSSAIRSSPRLFPCSRIPSSRTFADTRG